MVWPCKHLFGSGAVEEAARVSATKVFTPFKRYRVAVKAGASEQVEAELWELAYSCARLELEKLMGNAADEGGAGEEADLHKRHVI